MPAGLDLVLVDLGLVLAGLDLDLVDLESDPVQALPLACNHHWG